MNSFSFQHVLVIFISIILCTWFPLFARNRLSSRTQLWVLRVVSMIVCAGILSSSIFRMIDGSFLWRENLPLNICNTFALILPFLFWNKPSRHLVEVFYYIILAGTLQAVLTPDLDQGFPHVLFFSYWVVHIGLILYILSAVMIWRIYPRFIAMFYSILWFNAYVLIIMIFNYFTGSNYLYLMEKPTVGTLMDFLGPWPWYILTGQPLGLLLFFLSWLPFARFKSTKPSIDP